MKDFDLCRAVYARLEPALNGRVELGSVVVHPEEVLNPRTFIHPDEHVPEDVPGMAVRNDSAFLLLTTVLDAEPGEVITRVEPHQQALRKALFADHNLGGVHGITELRDRGSRYGFNKQEMTFVIEMRIEVRFRRGAEQP